MNEKEIYAVYVGTMKIHKKYAAHVRDMAYLHALIADINQLNSAHNSNFCNAMTEVLRQWFIGRFLGADPGKLSELYTELWRFHKKYLCQVHDDAYWAAFITETDVVARRWWQVRQVEMYLLAIADELEMQSVEKEQNESPEGQKPESERADNEQKEKRESATK